MAGIPDDLAGAVCRKIAEGRSLRSVMAETEGVNWFNWYQWVEAAPQNAEQYARAMASRADALFDEMLEIADTPLLGVVETEKADGSLETKRADMIEHRRLQVETRKWSLARMAPKKYGDKITQEHTGDLAVTVGGVALEFIRPNNPPQDSGGVRASLDDTGEV